MGRIKVIEFSRAGTFENALDSQAHNDRVRTMQYGTRGDRYYIVYESLHEASPHRQKVRS